VGTVEYAPPEQWVGQIVVASDIYALGGTLFYMLTGRHVFKKEKRDHIAFMHSHLRESVPDLLAFNPAVPPEIKRLFERMMAKDHKARGTASELLEEFQQLLPREVTVASPPQPSSSTFKPGRVKSAAVATSPPMEIEQPDQPLDASPEMKIQNPVARLVDGVLSLLERIFIPGHLRISYDTDIAIFERMIALLRRPLVLAIIAIILVILIVCY
jgi:serine/threonine protein kinase